MGLCNSKPQDNRPKKLHPLLELMVKESTSASSRQIKEVLEKVIATDSGLIDQQNQDGNTFLHLAIINGKGPKFTLSALKHSDPDLTIKNDQDLSIMDLINATWQKKYGLSSGVLAVYQLIAAKTSPHRREDGSYEFDGESQSSYNSMHSEEIFKIPKWQATLVSDPQEFDNPYLAKDINESEGIAAQRRSISKPKPASSPKKATHQGFSAGLRITNL